MFQQHEWNFFRLYGNVELHFQLFNGFRFWFYDHLIPKIALMEKIISKSMILKAHFPLVYLEWNFLQLLPNPNEYQPTFQQFKYYLRESYLLWCKVGCIFPMVISSEFRMGQFRDDDHRRDAPHFIIWPILFIWVI